MNHSTQCLSPFEPRARIAEQLSPNHSTQHSSTPEPEPLNTWARTAQQLEPELLKIWARTTQHLSHNQRAFDPELLKTLDRTAQYLS